MKRVESYEALSAALSAQLGRGTRSNAFAGEEEYRREIAAGGLFMSETPQGLLLFRRREGFWRMNFHLRGEETPAVEPTELPVVMEMPRRERDGALEGTEKDFVAQGFAPALRRKRLARPGGCLPPLEEAEAVAPAEPEELPKVKELLCQSFHPLFGCIPTGEELARDVALGQVLVVRGDGLLGLLHYLTGRGGVQIRHLAVREDIRGRGVGKTLVGALLARRGQEKTLVWAAEDNPAAQGVYAARGFVPDGWRSTVLCRR